jgi:hypothetical protein
MHSDLEILLSDLETIDSEIAALNERREGIRAAISEIVAASGNRIALSGYGTLTIRPPSIARIWDGKALDGLMQSLRETGFDDLANEIDACRKQSPRVGGLTISRERE